MITEITQKVSIDSKYLDSNISHHLLKKIKENMEGKCYLDYGYIIKVNNIIDIGSNVISPATLMAVYNVKYEADIIKPVKGLILSGEICMIFKQGIFVNILDKMKVLIPENNIEGYKFIDDIFVSKDKDTEDLVLNKKVEIEITMVKYENKSFSCIGKILSTTET